MKTIQIQAVQFFELLKLKDTSMWKIFAQMIDGEEREIIFIDENKNILFNYALPTTVEQLKEDQKKFSKEYSEKLSRFN